MNEEDRKAFETACKDWAIKSAGKDLGEYFWQAALEWRDSQSAQINQQIVDALQFVIDCQESTNGSDYQSGSALREAANMARAALAATQMRGDA